MWLIFKPTIFWLFWLIKIQKSQSANYSAQTANNFGTKQALFIIWLIERFAKNSRYVSTRQWCITIQRTRRVAFASVRRWTFRGRRSHTRNIYVPRRSVLEVGGMEVARETRSKMGLELQISLFSSSPSLWSISPFLHRPFVRSL